jgi:enamine deaminase RidA (YjgF/YER057c/UK114 family)
MNEQWNDKFGAKLFYRESTIHSGKEVYITLQIKEALSENAQLNICFERLAAFLAERNILVMQEKVYGLTSHAQDIITTRNKQYSEKLPSLAAPCTFIDGTPCIGGIFAGLQIIGFIPRNTTFSITPVTKNNKHIGVVFEDSEYKKLFLSGISDEALASSAEKQTLYQQTKSMFYLAKDILAEHNINFDQILRTWIYFPRILDWYGEFNRARTDCFKELGLISNTRNYLPASTGIQGKRTDTEECFMDVLGFVSKNTQNISTSIMNNSRQNEADEYGSSFSRGISIDSEFNSTMYISGTASINNEGQTVYHQDYQGQMFETLTDIAALLQTKGSKLSDIVLATAYCKDEKMFNEYQRIIELFELDDMPLLPVYADVCRDELLFEVDSIAVKHLKG